MGKIRLPANGWVPRSYQMPLWRYLEGGGGRRAVAVWHRRAGKDEVCLHWAAVAGSQRAATYWHMLPEASQARKAIWEAINPHTGIRRIDEAFPVEIRDTTREQEMLIKLRNGSTWQVVGSDNYDSLVGSPPAGVVFSEWPLGKEDAWAYLRPILAENNGWALFIYTPRGDNHGKRSYDFALTDPGWFCELLTADDTKVFSPDRLESERREMISQYGESRGNALFRQEYYCSWIEAFEGAVVYPEFNQKTHVSTVPLLPFLVSEIKTGTKVIRGWDNTGLSPACIITFVNSTGQWCWVKEFIGEDVGITDFAQMVDFWCRETLPGNVKFRDIGDPAGKTRDSTKQSPKDYIFKATGIRIEDGIQTFKVRRESVSFRLTKLINGKPGLVVDPSCKTAITGFMGGYCYPEIANTGYFRPEPSKNKLSHIHDAGQYIATKLFKAGVSKSVQNMNGEEDITDKSTAYGFTNISSRYKPEEAGYKEYYTTA